MISGTLPPTTVSASEKERDALVRLVQTVFLELLVAQVADGNVRAADALQAAVVVHDNLPVARQL